MSYYSYGNRDEFQPKPHLRAWPLLSRVLGYIVHRKQGKSGQNKTIECNCRVAGWYNPQYYLIITRNIKFVSTCTLWNKVPDSKSILWAAGFPPLARQLQSIFIKCSGYENLWTSLNVLKPLWYLARYCICIWTDFSTEKLWIQGQPVLDLCLSLAQSYCCWCSNTSLSVFSSRRMANVRKNASATYCNVKSEHTFWVIRDKAPSETKGLLVWQRKLQQETMVENGEHAVSNKNEYLLQQQMWLSYQGYQWIFCLWRSSHQDWTSFWITTIKRKLLSSTKG